MRSLTPALVAHQARIQQLYLELRAIGDSHYRTPAYVAKEAEITKESRAFYAAQGEESA